MSMPLSPICNLLDPWLESPGDPSGQFRAGPWELTTRIASSRWHELFRARAADTGETGEGRYVVKMAARSAPAPDRAWSRQMLARECQAGRAISSPHVVCVLAGDIEHAWPHLAFPYLPGETLRQRLEALPEPRWLDLPETIWIARQMAQALAAAHRAGWIHGDVKPENIHLGWNGHATLLDLGFALPFDEAQAPGPFDPLCCTPRYAAPEQFDTFRTITPAADIYSLGCVIHECLLGAPPHEYADLGERIAARRMMACESPARMRGGISGELDHLLRRTLARDPLRRPDASELVDRLIAREIPLIGAPCGELGRNSSGETRREHATRDRSVRPRARLGLQPLHG